VRSLVLQRVAGRTLGLSPARDLTGGHQRGNEETPRVLHSPPAGEFMKSRRGLGHDDCAERTDARTTYPVPTASVQASRHRFTARARPQVEPALRSTSLRDRRVGRPAGGSRPSPRGRTAGEQGQTSGSRIEREGLTSAQPFGRPAATRCASRAARKGSLHCHTRTGPSQEWRASD
jgi:hypothetical protein